MESYRDTRNPWISTSVRVDRPAPRGGHCTGPHLDGCRAHGGAPAARYTTAGALSVTLIAWLAVAQYLGSANTYFATAETVLLRLLMPLIIAAVGLWRSG